MIDSKAPAFLRRHPGPLEAAKERQFQIPESMAHIRDPIVMINLGAHEVVLTAMDKSQGIQSARMLPGQWVSLPNMGYLVYVAGGMPAKIDLKKGADLYAWLARKGIARSEGKYE